MHHYIRVSGHQGCQKCSKGAIHGKNQCPLIGSAWSICLGVKRSKGGEGSGENVFDMSVAIDQPKLGGSQLSISIFALSAAMPVFPIIHWQSGDYHMVYYVGGDQWSLWILSSNIDYIISYFLFVLVNHFLSLFIKFSFSIKQPPKINQFLRRWHDPRDHRESYWEEIGIDDVLIMEAGDTAHHHWMMCYTGPFEVSHHYLNALSYEDWERIRLACIITIGHSAIRAVRVVVREGSIGSIRYRQGIYH